MLGPAMRNVLPLRVSFSPERLTKVVGLGRVPVPVTVVAPPVYEAAQVEVLDARAAFLVVVVVLAFEVVVLAFVVVVVVLVLVVVATRRAALALDEEEYLR